MNRLPKAQEASFTSFFSETDTLLDASMKQLSDVAHLINDASDVMRFEQGGMLQTVPVPTPLKDICRAAVDHIKGLAKPSVHVAFEFERGASVASVDAKVLHRALYQLLRNAAEATPEGGSIVLKLRPEKDSQPGGEPGGAPRLCFELRDTGGSLETSDPARLFSRYSHWGATATEPPPPPLKGGTPEGSSPEASDAGTPVGGTSTGGAGTSTEGGIASAREELEGRLLFSAHTARPGLGIGLNLAYGLVRAMGGELRAESSPGHHTTFWFVLPAADAHTPLPDERYVATGSHSGAEGHAQGQAGWARGDRIERKRRRKADWEPFASTGEGREGGSTSGGGGTTSDSDSNPFPGASLSMPPRQWEEEEQQEPCRKVVQVCTSYLLVSHPRSFLPTLPTCLLACLPTSSFLPLATCPLATCLLVRPQASEVASRGLMALDAPHILVVEDTPMCAMIVCMLLKKLGCSTDHAENGVEALAMLKKAEPGLYSMVCNTTPDYSITTPPPSHAALTVHGPAPQCTHPLQAYWRIALRSAPSPSSSFPLPPPPSPLCAAQVLMDLRMPVMDGFEATKAIKEMAMTRPLPVVALTADEGFDTRDRCFSIGFDDFATKPMRYEELARLIQKHTGHCVSSSAAGPSEERRRMPGPMPPS